MAIDVDTHDPVTMIFETDCVRQKPLGFSTYRKAIIAVMETLAREDRESAIICGRWNTIKYHEIARHYANLSRMNLLNAAPPRPEALGS